MRELERQIQALRAAIFKPAGDCLDCAMRRYEGGSDLCPEVKPCASAGKGWDWHLTGLNELGQSGAVFEDFRSP